MQKTDYVFENSAYKIHLKYEIKRKKTNIVTVTPDITINNRT